VSTYRKVAGPESREYAEGLYHFANFYAGCSQFEYAEAVLKKLMEVAAEEIDVAEFEKADYFELYGNVLEAQGRTEEAQIQFKRVEEIWSKHDNA
jgi:tetratricopeptide (TPR) repeat protein